MDTLLQATISHRCSLSSLTFTLLALYLCGSAQSRGMPYIRDTWRRSPSPSWDRWGLTGPYAEPAYLPESPKQSQQGTDLHDESEFTSTNLHSDSHSRADDEDLASYALNINTRFTSDHSYEDSQTIARSQEIPDYDDQGPPIGSSHLEDILQVPGKPSQLVDGPANPHQSEPSTRCQYNLIVQEMDLAQCPQMKTDHQGQPVGRTYAEQLNTEHLAQSKRQFNDFQSTLQITTKQTNALVDSLNTHQQEIQQNGNLLTELQRNFTQLLELTESLQDAARDQGAQYGALEAKMGGLIMDVAQMKQAIYRARTAGEDAETKNVLVQDPIGSECDVQNGTTYRDCTEVYTGGHRHSGVYYITPLYMRCSIPVYCDMTTPSSGWTIFQRRRDGGTDFNHNWDEYRQGFGDVNKDFWLGNSALFLLTNQKAYKLRVDMWDFYGSKVFAEYDFFKVDGERDNYTLRIANHSGTAPDGLSNHNNVAFSTPDHDSDAWPDYHCAQEWGAGWWFNNCWFVILNGPYYNQSNVEYRGISWNEWKAEQLKHVEMKIQPIEGNNVTAQQ